MTRLSQFVGTQTMPELYDRYLVPTALDPFARAMALKTEPGTRVLDLGTGTGLVAIYAAEHVGPDGEIVGLDPTPDLLAAARAKKTGGAPVEWIEGSGEDMSMFDDDTFDAVLCHQGLQYVTDRAATFAEVRRVLKPGGKFHAGVWSCAAEQPAFGFVEDSLARHFGAEQKPVHAWSFGGLGELRSLAEAAGSTVERLEKVELPWRFESIQQYVDIQVACAGRTDENGQLALGLVDLEDEAWLPAIEAFGADAEAGLGEYVEAGGALVAPFGSDEVGAVAHARSSR